MALRIKNSSFGDRESLGPFRKYLLTRGLVLDFDAEGANVTDRAGSALSFPIDEEPNEYGLYSPLEYACSLDEVERRLGVKFVGFFGAPSEGTAFRVNEYAMSGTHISEALLAELLKLENLIRKRVLSTNAIGESELKTAVEIVWALDDDISYGKVGLVGLKQAIDRIKILGMPINEAFFICNAKSISEDLRNAMLGACFHFHTLNSRILAINESDSSPDFLSATDQEPWEILIRSPYADELSFTFTSAVVTSYTALDLLYAYFVYLTREPFLNPKFPAGLHFSDVTNGKVFQKGGKGLPSDTTAKKLPYAIPNMNSDTFVSLKKSRNDLAHNMATDSIRPKVYKGWKQPPVNHHALQYVQYLSRDIDVSGDPVTHDWVRRFYENQSDGQVLLLEWLEMMWQCVFDTIEWLNQRWSHHVVNTANASSC